MTSQIPDIIDHLLGVTPDATAHALRTRRPITRENADKSYRALFESESVAEVSLVERFAVAAFVASLHEIPEIADFYAVKLAETSRNGTQIEALKQAAEEARTRGPYGRYPEGPLTAENEDGPVYKVSEPLAAILGRRLVAALEHAHLLVFHLRDASPEHLQKLGDAGWSTTGIVTLSQLVAFLAFQIRVVAGLKVLVAA